jgi:CheY-like chemotaxis protein
MPHKLLLADDSITIQRVIELTFADEDVQVLAVGDGKKAIESIQADRPDIVLADVGMPERDGYEVAEFIKRNPQLASIPVLLLTGAFEPIDETRARAVGCDGVLVKPFEPQMVINRVKDLLAGRRSGGLWGTKPAPPATERTPASVDKDATSNEGGTAPATSASLEEYFDRLDAAFASVEAATEARSATSSRPQPAPASAASGSATTAPSGLATHQFPDWDPDLAGDPKRSTVAATPSAIQASPIEPLAAQHPAVTSLPAAAAAHERPATAAIPEGRERPDRPVQRAVPPAPASTAPSQVTASRPASDSPIPLHTPAPVDRAAPPSQTPGGAAQRPAALSTPSLAEAFAALLSAEQGRRVSPSSVGSSTISDEAMEEIVRRVLARMTDQVVRDVVIDVAERLVREEIDRIKQKQ